MLYCEYKWVLIFQQKEICVSNSVEFNSTTEVSPNINLCPVWLWLGLHSRSYPGDPGPPSFLLSGPLQDAMHFHNLTTQKSTLGTCPSQRQAQWGHLRNPFTKLYNTGVNIIFLNFTVNTPTNSSDLTPSIVSIKKATETTQAEGKDPANRYTFINTSVAKQNTVLERKIFLNREAKKVKMLNQT